MTDASLFSPETENVVLSLLLRNPALCSKLEGLHFYMMSSAPNQVLLSEVEELVSKDLQPDFTLLLATMEANGNLKKCGGKAYLDYLINLDYPIEHFQEFVKLVISSYKARAFVSITSQIKPETLSTSNIDSKINSVREKLDDLSQATSTGDVVHISENISNAFDEIVQRTKNPGVRGVPWNIRKIDLVTGGKNPGDVWFIGGRPGSGKCLGKGTEIVMYDGTTKVVEDIITGDLLMGVDSKPRTVLSTTTGKELMYWVRQNKGIDYRVNASHILSLKRSRNGNKHTHGDVLNIPVKDYIKTSNKFKTNYKGYKVAVDFQERELPIEPYFLGIWLGDGSASDSEITKPDIEIEEYLKSYSYRIGMRLSIHGYKNRCKSYTLISGDGEGMLAKLRRLDLINNKHIPHIYLANSKSNRMQLLAGLLDTDGSLNKGKDSFEITQKSKILAEQIKYLADSLGFRTSIREKIGRIKSTNFEGLYYRVIINGDVDTIPTQIERKKASKPKNTVDKTMTGIKLEDDGIGEYYGFELDGDGLFLLKDMTVTHNTAIICNAALRDGESGEPSLIISKEMNYQTLLERFVAIDSGVGISNIRLGLLNQAQLDLVRDSLNRIKKYPIYLDTNFATDTYHVENIIRKYANKHDVKTVYIDYIQLLVERDDSMTHALGKLSRMFKLNANALGISIVTLSQLNRDVEHRDNKRPQMSDLRQSGNLEEDADIVVGLYRDEYYNKDTKYPGTMEFTILKNRNGPVGTVTLDFVAETNRVEST